MCVAHRIHIYISNEKTSKVWFPNLSYRNQMSQKIVPFFKRIQYPTRFDKYCRLLIVAFRFPMGYRCSTTVQFEVWKYECICNLKSVISVDVWKRCVCVCVLKCKLSNMRIVDDIYLVVWNLSITR